MPAAGVTATNPATAPEAPPSIDGLPETSRSAPIQVSSPAEFERIHTEVLAAMPGVLRIHSSFAIRNVLAKKKPVRGR